MPYSTYLLGTRLLLPPNFSSRVECPSISLLLSTPFGAPCLPNIVVIMAFQVDLDNQVFWKPRSVVRNADADHQQSPASSASQRQSPSMGNRYAPTRQNNNATAEVSPSPGQSVGNCDAIYISDDATSEISDIASVHDNLKHAQLDCTLPSVEALAASIKEQAQAEDGVSTWRWYPVQ